MTLDFEGVPPPPPFLLNGEKKAKLRDFMTLSFGD